MLQYSAEKKDYFLLRSKFVLYLIISYKDMQRPCRWMKAVGGIVDGR
jgi:hypothetical protein